MQLERQRAFAVLLVWVFAAFSLAAGAPAGAQTSGSKDYKPVVGQEGKDVIWVPTSHALVERMLQMAKTAPGDYVIDLGSGDGRTVITAAKKYGVKALGIEYNPDMVALSRRNAAEAGVADRARFVQGDIFQTDFSKATVLTLYLLPNLNLKLRPTILAMQPGTRVVSHAFSMGEWQPDRMDSVEGQTAYLWIVPAKVEGRWHWNGRRDYELLLEQRFQEVEGLVKIDHKLAQFRNPRLQGGRLSFSVIEHTPLGDVQHSFSGDVSGDTITGSARRTDAAGEQKWIATRAAGH